MTGTYQEQCRGVSIEEVHLSVFLRLTGVSEDSRRLTRTKTEDAGPLLRLGAIVAVFVLTSALRYPDVS
jgi:hypothetical protein